MNLPFDLDDEELKATRKLNGADNQRYKNLETLKDLYEQKILYVVGERGIVPATMKDIEEFIFQETKKKNKKGKHE